MRLLFLAPRFYGIEDEICLRLGNLGYEVIFVENKILKFDYHGRNAKFVLLRKLIYFFFRPDVQYIRKSLNSIQNKRFDILFTINCHSVCQYLLIVLKKENPSLRSILFLWDSMSCYSWQKEAKLFDKSFSFDRKDASDLSIEYKPNFFMDIKDQKSDFKHDILFAGKFNYRRLLIIDEIYKKGSSLNLDMYIKLWAGYKKMFHNKYLYQIFKSKREYHLTRDYVFNYEAIEKILTRDFIIYDRLSWQEIHNHICRANVILDINYYEQCGYSHRIIEALSLGKKILTTNKNITNETFYNKDQFKLIGDGLIDLDPEWIRDAKIYSVPEEVNNLELTKWLISILDEKNSKKAS